MLTTMTVVIQRDSVCAGDDGDAPHEEHRAFDKAVTVDAALAEIKASRYLASISGGKATWVARGRTALGVVAQEWPEVRLLVDRPALLAEHLDDGSKLYFDYLAQESPEVVFERERQRLNQQRERSPR